MENEVFELTNAQRSIWNTELFFSGSNINNICGTINLFEPLDFDTLKKALDLIVKENDNFHTKFFIKEACVYQTFQKDINYDIEIVDINTKDELKILEEQMMSKVFDVLNSPLFEIKIFRYKDQTGGVIVNIHHLISDSWTLGLIATSIVNNYYALHNNLSLPQKKNSYKDYINSEKKYISSLKFEKDKEFWKKYLENRPDSITIPNFNDDNTKQDFSYKANRKLFNIDSKLVNKMNDYCKNHNVSLYNFLMAIYSIYIGRVNNSSDFIIGTPILNRTSSVQKNTMGMFINTVPVRMKTEDDITFSDFVNNIAIGFTSIYRHQKYSYQYILEDLRKEDPNVPNLYKILLSYQITKITTDDDMKYVSDWNFNGSIADDMDIHFFDLNASRKFKYCI